MEKDSTTDAADNQADLDKDNQPDPKDASTESTTDADKTGADNRDTSKSTDDSDDGDKSKSTDKKDDDSSASTFDTDLDEWAEKTGRAKPTTDRERELYQEIRDGQREYSRTKAQKDATQSIEKAIDKAKPADKPVEGDDDEDDPVAKDVADLKRQNTEERHLRMRSEYFAEKSVTPEQSDMMGKILQEKVDKVKSPQDKQRVLDYWTHPDQLEDWHALAKGRLAESKPDTSVIEEEAARKERERIAKESQAAGGNRNASTTGPSKKQGYNRTEFLKSNDD